MKRVLTLAAAAVVASMAFAAAPAQARMYNPALSEIAPASALAQDVHYRSYRHSHRYNRHNSRWRHQRQRYRHCYNQRIRVHVPGGRIVFRTKRNCGWRYR